MIDALRYIAYRIKWHMAQYMDFSAPIHLDLELNNNCNQRCVSCWHHDGASFPIGMMDYSDAVRYLDDFRALGGLSVKLNFRGEPLLYPSLIKVIQHAKQLGFVDIMINTNGMMLSKSMLDDLHIAGLTTLIVSVDSLIRDNYKKIHNATDGQFNRLLSALKFIREGNYNFRTKLNFHVNAFNQDEDFSVYRRIEWADVVIRNTQNREGGHISVVDNSKRKRKKRCPHMQRRILITQNHKAYPCCVAYNEPEDIRLNQIQRFVNFGYGNDYVGPMNLDIDDYWSYAPRTNIQSCYKRGLYLDTCKNCTSGDIFK